MTMKARMSSVNVVLQDFTSKRTETKQEIDEPILKLIISVDGSEDGRAKSRCADDGQSTDEGADQDLATEATNYEANLLSA